MTSFIQLAKPSWRCDSIHATPEMGPVLENIVSESEAQTHALSWVFSRLEFKGASTLGRIHAFGRDGRSGNARRMADSMFSTSRPPYALENADGGLQSQSGAGIYDHGQQYHHAQNGPSGQHAHHLPRLYCPTRRHRSRAYFGAFPCSQRQRPCRRGPLYPGNVHAETGLQRIEEWRCSMSAAINTTADTRTRHAKATAYACGFLALLIFIVNAWLVIEGIQSTEPASEARYAHIAQSVLLALIEFSLFAISGLFPEFKNSFRAIGIVILLLEIGLMSISQISTGLTAGKVAARSEDVVAQLKAKADISLNQIKIAQETAKNLNGSKHGWRHEQAAQQTNLAAVQSKSAASDVERLEAASTTGAAVSTPMVEIIGKNGLIALSIALAFGLSIAGIALTHCMGSLIRRSGVMPVDLQILELLHKVHGSPVAPVPVPVPASFKPAGVIAPKDASTGLSYSSKTALAGAGALAALSAAPMTHAAPVNAPVGALEQSRSGASEQSHFSEAKKPAMNSLGTTEMPGKSETERVHLASASASKTDAPKRAWTATAVPDGDKLDSAVSGKGATRYNRIKTAIRAGKLKPSMRAIQAAEGGGGIVVRRYLQQLETEGVIIKAGRGYALAANKGGAA